jgi:hypothetical protein
MKREKRIIVHGSRGAFTVYLYDLKYLTLCGTAVTIRTRDTRGRGSMLDFGTEEEANAAYKAFTDAMIGHCKDEIETDVIVVNVSTAAAADAGAVPRVPYSKLSL